jgi:tRNA 5-methylaminomethyl-2-thiouridine biosynthesis bifunctional protein
MPKPPNRLQFKDAKTPYSEQFGDIYFANEMGIEESIYVYLEGSGVQAAIHDGRPLIRVGEVGFGVGLNFLLTLRAFLAGANTDQRMHYVSAEKFPIEAEDLFTLYHAYPELEPFAKLLLDQYPVLTPGNHRLFFANGRLVLDLMIGDASVCFEQSDFTADFWYWDGFAPSKNPDAFSDELFSAVQKRSTLGTRGVSFTAAGWVRRSLEPRGFQVSKRPGYGKKRECIEAVLIAEAEKNSGLAWFSRERFHCLNPGDHIGVLGAGLAGTAIARTLAERGFNVSVYDGNGIAYRASSNSVGLFNVQLSKKINPISRFSQASLTHLIRELKNLEIPHHLGISRRDPDAAECLESSVYPESFYQIREDGVHFPACGMINPRTLCEKRMAHPLIQFHEKSIVRVERTNEKCILFAAGDEKVADVDHLVYALGADVVLKTSILQHESIDNLPLRAIRGQTILVKSTSESEALSEVLVEDGYASPVALAVTGHPHHLIGATFQAKDILPNQEAIDSEKLILEAKVKWSQFRNLNPHSIVSSKIGFRASSPDKLPLIGPLADVDFAKTEYSRALKGAVSPRLPPLKITPREWALMGLGSRGISFSSLGSEILASLMTGFPLPIETDLFHHLHPIRFTIRTLKKSN